MRGAVSLGSLGKRALSPWTMYKIRGVSFEYGAVVGSDSTARRGAALPGWGGQVQELREGIPMPISIDICIQNGDVRIPNRQYTISCVRPRGQLGCVWVCRDISVRCDCGGGVRMYGAGDGGGVGSVQTAREDDGEPG